MAEVRRTGGAGNLLRPRGAAAVRKAAVNVLNVSLPDEPSVPSHSLDDYSLLFHGEKKIGKTTLTMEGGGKPLLLTFDPLQQAYSLFQRHVPDWAHFMAYLQLLERRVAEGKFDYTRIVVDGTDIWYRRCQAWTCKILGVSHPQEAEWGKGWDLLKETFSTAVERVLALPCGVWFISHSEWREVQTRKGGPKIEKLMPLMKSGGQEILTGKIDGTFAYDYDGSRRVLCILGDATVMAGHRIKGHFLTPDGRRVAEIPMGNSEEEAYANFIAAFNNEQTFTSLLERDRATQPAPKGTATPAVRRPLLRRPQPVRR